MPFPRIQKYRPAFGGSVVTMNEVELPTGNFEVQAVDASETVMPKPELFDIKNQLEAGIQLEEVNSKVLQRGTVSAASVVRKYTKKSTPSTEVTNEN